MDKTKESSPRVIIPHKSENTPVGTIDFSEKVTSSLLSPAAEAICNIYGVTNNDGGTEQTLNVEIVINALVFLDVKIKNPNLSVYQQFNGDDNEVPYSYYIAYDSDVTPSNKYNAYQLYFNLKLDDNSKLPFTDIKLVELFLWDEDPKTSRGMVTNVQMRLGKHRINL